MENQADEISVSTRSEEVNEIKETKEVEKFPEGAYEIKAEDKTKVKTGSGSDAIPLTEEQKALLKEFEEEFKNRYTDLDPEFKKVWNSAPSTPPIMENWDLVSGKRSRQPNDGHGRNKIPRYSTPYNRKYRDEEYSNNDNYNHNYNYAVHSGIYGKRYC